MNDMTGKSLDLIESLRKASSRHAIISNAATRGDLAKASRACFEAGISATTADVAVAEGRIRARAFLNIVREYGMSEHLGLPCDLP